VSPVETTPDRLIAALTAAGWIEESRCTDLPMTFVRLIFRGEETGDPVLDLHRPIIVPLNPQARSFDRWMSRTLEQLRRQADIGAAADRALTEATCPCGGRRWVDDENWQPDYWAMEVQPRREPRAGLIPCGNCNEGGWDVPVGAV
jgi:hypothetical protein